MIKLRPHSDKQISQADGLIEAFEEDLGSLQPLAGYSKGAGANRLHFVWRAIQLWMLLTNGDTGFARGPGPGGPLIRFLIFACELVMGERPPAPETLAHYIKRFRKEFAGRESRIVFF